MTLPLPEMREMVEAAKRYLAGKTHFSSLVGPTEQCEWWSRVYGAHPAIRQLAKDWQLWVDQVWNEWGQHSVKLPETELRRRIGADLGLGDPAVA